MRVSGLPDEKSRGPKPNGPRGGGKAPSRAQAVKGRGSQGVVGRPASGVAINAGVSAASRVSPARAAAFAVLERVGATSGHSDDLLHGPLLAGMSQADRDLATALVMGVLRWQIALDARIRPLLSRPDMRIAEPVAISLRMGAFQMLEMERIPAHAALNESVELVRAAGQEHAAGMVNAVLRKLVGGTKLSAARRPLVESTEAMAERLGHPAWLVQRWVATYGRAAAEGICGFDQKEPGCAPMFAEEAGAMPVMDAGSRLVAELAAAARPEARRVWDCCAAPGGKTIVLAQRLAGAELLATDASAVRARRLGERLRRELPDLEVRVEVGDAADLSASFGESDLILCDVPCSGTGTLARNPEIRHRLRVEELSRQAERQRRILSGALRRLGHGGRMVYSTCSLEPEECERVVARVLEENDAGVRRVPVEPFLDALRERGRLQVEPQLYRDWTRDGSLRTLPGVRFEGDGFFAAILERA